MMLGARRHLVEEEEEHLEVIVVEYLEKTMSKELLCKFPDNSAFDFDYSQSSIWSPLLHRPFPPLISPSQLSSFFTTVNAQTNPLCSAANQIATPRKLAYGDAEVEDDDDEEEKEKEEVQGMLLRLKKKVTANFDKKIGTCNFFGNFSDQYTKLNMKQRKEKKMTMKNASSSVSFDFSPMANSSAAKTNRATPRKGWARVLRAASKRFKRATNKKDLTSHVKLTNCLMMNTNF